MPLIIPENLPARDLLVEENIFVMNEKRAITQDIRPIHVAIVNLMPKKEETELQFLRLLSNTPLQVEVDLIRTESYESKNTDIRHLEQFYKTFSQIKNKKYDAMIITGAPVELIKFEEILYWDELKEILDYAKTHVYSTMFVCWAAQAALYHYYKVPKRSQDEKIFGVFDYSVLTKNLLTKGFDDVFYTPQSRHTFTCKSDLEKIENIDVIAERPDTGVHLAATKDCRFVFVAGHWEYDPHTLENEYLRDKSQGLEIDVPINYYINDDDTKGINVRWRSHGNLFFYNWLNEVYQSTPYDVDSIEEKIVMKKSCAAQ